MSRDPYHQLMHTTAPYPFLLDNDRVNTWYYRDAPAVGSVVMYANETYIETVKSVTLTHIWLESGRSLRRPYIARRLVRWSIHQYRTRKHRTSNRETFDLPRAWSASTV